MLDSRLAAALILSIGGATPAVAQVQSAWNVQYRHDAKPHLYPLEVLPLPNGGVVTVGLAFATSSRQGDANVVVAGFDEQGENLWSWTDVSVADNGTLLVTKPMASAGVDAAGNVYIAYGGATTSSVVSLGPDGAMRWQNSLMIPPGTSGCAATSIDVTPAGDVRVAAFGFENTTWPAMEIEAFDALGSRTWAWSGGFNQGVTGIPHGVKIGPNGETYVYGQNDSSIFAQYYKTFAMRLDSAGLLVWYDDLATNAGQLAYRYGDLAPNGDLVVAAAGWVSNFPGSDRVAYAHRFGPSGRIQGGASLSSYLPQCCGFMRELKVGAGGESYVAFDSLPEVVRFDAGGALLPTWPMPAGTADADIMAILPTADGGAIVSAARQLPTPSGTVDVRFDAAGAVVWTQERFGQFPVGVDDEFAPRTDLDIAIDARGNILLANVSTSDGDNEQRSGIQKLIEGPAVGGNYCGPAPVNSTGAPASIRALGSDARSADNLSLLVADLPVGTFVLFLASPQTGLVVGPGGSQGNLCLGGHIGRYLGTNQIRRARQNGTAYLQLDLDLIPRPLMFQSAAVGETWNFQATYRDTVGGMATSNFTDGVGVQMR